MGRTHDLAAGTNVLAELERNLDQLRIQLERLLQAHRVSGVWKGDQAMSTGEAPLR
jgi:hypothetical protein